MKIAAIRATLFVCAASMLAGCATLGGEGGSWTRVDPGSTVEVRQALTIPVGEAAIFLQDGVVLGSEKPDKGTWCRLRMRDLHEAGEPQLRIEPGSFAIRRLRESSEDGRFPGPPMGFGESLIDRPMGVVSSVEMYLDSDLQPDVYALTCSKNAGVYNGWDRRRYFPDLAEIGAALGAVVVISPP